MSCGSALAPASLAGGGGGSNGEKNQKSIIEIYTDWANHYLEKTKGKRRIQDLQNELSDGVVLCEVIEAVTGQRVPDVNKKPKTNSAMITNIQACLNFLLAKGVTIDEIRPEEIREGNLKAILSLFFQLSRYKQQQKQQQQANGPSRASCPNSPAKYPPGATNGGFAGGGSNIPLPGSMIMSPKRSVGAAKSDRDTGVNGQYGVARSQIPAARSNSQHTIQTPSSLASRNGGSRRIQAAEGTGRGGSMLERFKMGGSGGGKSGVSQIPGSGSSTCSTASSGVGLGKRTSSSSGFSSARSDRSESSISLSSDTNFPSPSALKRIQENSVSSGDGRRLGLRHKLTGRSSAANAAREKSSSPKRSPKLGRANGSSGAGPVTEIKDYGLIDDGSRIQQAASPRQEHYPPHAYSRSNSGLSFKHTNISSRDEMTGLRRGSQPDVANAASSPAVKASKLGGSGIPRSGRLPPVPPTRSTSSGTQQMPGTGRESTPPKSQINLAEAAGDEPSGGDAEGQPAQQHQLSAKSSSSSLPRQKRRGDMSPGPNVAIVSPMPSLKRTQSSGPVAPDAQASNAGAEVIPHCEKSDMKSGNINRDESESDPLQGIAPMAPLGVFRSQSQASNAVTHQEEEMAGNLCNSGRHSVMAGNVGNPSMQTVNHSLVTGGLPSGYMSDSDVVRGGKNKIDSGYISEGGFSDIYGVRGSPRGPMNGHKPIKGADEPGCGYISEGGHELYSKRQEQRIAYERQREEAEAQHKKYLEMAGKIRCSSVKGHTPLPQVLGKQSHHGEVPSVYKVVGGKRNVAKADSGIQTDTSPRGDQQEEWRIAMERNRQLLTSQEKAMEEYLLRQRQEAERHIRNSTNSPHMSRKLSAIGYDVHTHPGRQQGIVSMPGTPTGNRRRLNPGEGQALQADRNKVDGGLGMVGRYQRLSRGGSLERQGSFKSLMQEHSRNDAFSDSEYMRGDFRHSASPPVNGMPLGIKESSKSLPKGTSALNYGLLMGQIQQKRQQRQHQQHFPHKHDGSLSDSNYATYSEIQCLQGGRGGHQNSPYSWLQPASTYSGWNNSLDEASAALMGSNESLNSSVSSSIKTARAHSLTKANVMAHQQAYEKSGFQRPGHVSQPPQSISPMITKPEETEYYGVPFMLKRSQTNKFSSQPTSPSQPPTYAMFENKNGIQNPGQRTNVTTYSSLPLGFSSEKSFKDKINGLDASKLERSQCNASTMSNEGASSGASIYFCQEEKTNADIALLKKELNEEHRKVLSLTNQLNTNAHVVAAFEQSLANMTSRLQEITRTAEKKDAELSDLRRTIEVLRQSGVDAGILSKNSSAGNLKKFRHSSGSGPNELMRQMSTDSVTSMSSAHSISSLCSGDDTQGSSNKGASKKNGSSNMSLHQGANSSIGKRSGWLRHSFSKAFSRSKNMKSGGRGGSVSDTDDGTITRMVENLEAQEKSREKVESVVPKHGENDLKSSQSYTDLRISASEGNKPSQKIDPQVVEELKRALVEKDSLLTETRLEALSSAHQLESLRDTITKMKTELLSLRQDNEKLQSQVGHKSLGSSESSLNNSHDSTLCRSQDIQEETRRLSLAMSEVSICSGPSTLDLSSTTDPSNHDSKLVSVIVQFTPLQVGPNNPKLEDLKIGNIAANGKLSWELLDSLIDRLFKEYIMLVDPVSYLGLSSESIHHYEVGEIHRNVKHSFNSGNSTNNPELLPYGYLVGDVNCIKVILKHESGAVDLLALETLLPKSILQRYLSLLQEHRRVILSGPPGTGKSYIAEKLANFYTSQFKEQTVDNLKQGASTSQGIRKFVIDRSNASTFGSVLDEMTKSTGDGPTPSIVIFDNLHLVPDLDDVLDNHLKSGQEMTPVIICTMIQHSSGLSTSSTTSLQLKHNFRWILCANHIEPVRGLLGRFLRRKLLGIEVETRLHDGDSARVVEWISRAYLLINKFLESHCGPEATLGPNIFLDCPITNDANSLDAAKAWFIKLWNLSIVPHILDCVRESLQIYGKRASWQDPLRVLIDTWPWPCRSTDIDNLVHIKPIDVGYDTTPSPNATTKTQPSNAPVPLIGSSMSSRPVSGSGGDGLSAEDPLFNMLMTLQEAANTESGDL